MPRPHEEFAQTSRKLYRVTRQLTIILAAAVQPTPPTCLTTWKTQVSPLFDTTTSPQNSKYAALGRQNFIKYCKNNILPDPSQMQLHLTNLRNERTPTRVLAAAVYSARLEKHTFDDTTPERRCCLEILS